MQDEDDMHDGGHDEEDDGQYDEDDEGDEDEEQDEDGEEFGMDDLPGIEDHEFVLVHAPHVLIAQSALHSLFVVIDGSGICSFLQTVMRNLGAAAEMLELS